LEPANQPIPSPLLITGAGGFIGSHVAERCVAAGCDVRAFVHYNGEGRAGWLDGSPARGAMEIVAGDLRDYDAVARAMEGRRAVLHLGALIGIPYSYESPLAYVRTNIEGTYNVLEAARRAGVERVAVTSTSETYGTAQRVPIDEGHPAVAQSPYAASKVAADQLALSYWRSFGLPVVVVRPFNVYGPRQSARAFIPTVVGQILAGRRELKLGNLTPTRDLTFVRDMAAAYCAAAACEGLIGRAVNIGMNEEIAMGDLARKIGGLMGAEATLTEEPQRARPAASEVERLRCDNTLLREATGWSPETKLERGLTETIEWIREHPETAGPERYRI
jgi:dTDP-glucose 4,6-dehydratase